MPGIQDVPAPMRQFFAQQIQRGSGADAVKNAAVATGQKFSGNIEHVGTLVSSYNKAANPAHLAQQELLSLSQSLGVSSQQAQNNLSSGVDDALAKLKAKGPHDFPKVKRTGSFGSLPALSGDTLKPSSAFGGSSPTVGSSPAKTEDTAAARQQKLQALKAQLMAPADKSAVYYQRFGVVKGERLSSPEKESIDWYRGGGYRDLNRQMRAGATLDTSTTQKMQDIMTGLEKHVKADDAKMYRGLKFKNPTEYQNFMQTIEAAHQQGHPWQDPALVSTSLRPSTAHTFAGDGAANSVVMMLHSKKDGSNGRVLNVSDTTETQGFSDAMEREVLFLPDTPFQITNIEKDKHSSVIHLQEL